MRAKTISSDSSRSFLDELAIGRYLPGRSEWHRASVPWKAALLSGIALLSFQLKSAFAFALLGATIAGIAARAGIPQTLFWRSLRPVTLLAWLTMLSGAFLNHPEASVQSLVFSWQGLQTGALFAARLFLITLLTTIFFLTTQPQLAIGLGVRLLAPLRLLGIDRTELTLLVHLAYRFVPLLTREVKDMKLGLQARGLPPPRGLWSRLMEGGDRLTFLLLGALQKAETAAFALEQRGVLEQWQEAPQDTPRGLGGWSAIALLLLGILLASYGRPWW